MTAPAPASNRGAPAGAGTRWAPRRAVPWVLVAAALLLAAVATGRRADGGRPLDPASAGPLGARALVLLLEELGARVEITRGAPTPTASTAVLLSDDLDEAARAELLHWVVQGGGTLLVADPLSELAPVVDRTEGGIFGPDLDDSARLRRACELPALREVEEVEFEGAVPFRSVPGGVGCFPIGRGFVVLARAEGAGVVVSVGGAAPFVNANIARADNAVLAASVLVPRAGMTVAFVESAAPAGGQTRLVDLIPRRLRGAFVQLLVAFALVVLWRGRRLGRPVAEPQPVEVEGSELVVAVGNLLQQARRTDAAAAMLGAELRRILADALGVPADSPPDVLADVLADVLGVRAGALPALSPERVAAALRPTGSPSEADLVTLAQTVEALRKELSHVR